jgi:hypothetical protein
MDTLPATDMTDMMKTVCSWRWLERLRLLVVRERKDRSMRTKGLVMLMVIVMSRKAWTKMVENWVADHNGAGILLGTKRAMICDGSTAVS